MELKEIIKAVEYVKSHCEHCDCCIGDYSECACARGLILAEDVDKYLEAQEE